jgi:adenylosuccinate lyase
MFPRYTNPEMGQIWTDENKFATWLKVELAIMQAEAEAGIIPTQAWKDVEAKAEINVERILEIEETVKHDVIAFTTSIAEYVGDSARFLHYGVTSSDVLDTSLALLVREAGQLIIKDIDAMIVVCKRRALEHKMTVMVGRTHGIHAEPTTLGMKFALWHQGMTRSRTRILAAIEDISFGVISGAVGTFAHLPPSIEERVCELLDLKPAPISTQVLQRDRHAAFHAALAVMAGTVEMIAVEIRGLQRTDIREVEEEFTKGQKGSSAMPHKRNPIGSENITGLSRIIRTNALAAMENQALWHERDISHSSVERVIFPDSCILADYTVRRLTKILDRLVVYPERMLENMWLTKGLVFSQRVMLALVNKDMSRENAYDIAQRNAMKCWETKTPLKDLLAADEEAMKHLTMSELDDLFTAETMLGSVDAIFTRVFG